MILEAINVTWLLYFVKIETVRKKTTRDTYYGTTNPVGLAI